MAATLAIIVVNYGSTHLLRQNLLRTAVDVRPEHVVVVDNLSTSVERDAVRELAASSGWELVETTSNLGFGGGMNLGVERALALGAEDLLLLNPDASITRESVIILQQGAADSRMSALAPRVIDEAGGVWFAGADVYLSDGVTMSARKRGLRPDDDRWEWLSGACLLIPHELWRATGGFDEDYFLYWEDVDFSRRVVAEGGVLRVIPGATAVHEEGGTQGRTQGGQAKSAGYYYYNIRNRMLFATKHLDDAGIRRWRRATCASAREVLLRGGRRQFLRPWTPLFAAFRGVRDGLRLSRGRRTDGHGSVLRADGRGYGSEGGIVRADDARGEQ